MIHQQRLSLIEGSTSIPLAMGLNMEHITIQANVDQVNISEEMSRTALWKSIVHNESSSNLISNGDEGRSSMKQRSVVLIFLVASYCCSVVCVILAADPLEQLVDQCCDACFFICLSIIFLLVRNNLRICKSKVHTADTVQAVWNVYMPWRKVRKKRQQRQQQQQ